MTTAIHIPEAPGYTFVVESDHHKGGRTITVQSATDPSGRPVPEGELNRLTDLWDDAIGGLAEEVLDAVEHEAAEIHQRLLASEDGHVTLVPRQNAHTPGVWVEWLPDIKPDQALRWVITDPGGSKDELGPEATRWQPIADLVASLFGLDPDALGAERGGGIEDWWWALPES